MRYWLTILILFIITGAAAQKIRVSGKVYDISQYRPLEAVTVLSSSGTGTISDTLGRYTIIVDESDSLSFSYLGKPTPYYPVKAILNKQNFELALHVNVTELKQVQVMPRNYRLDSIQNRLDYAKAFNFQKPGIGSTMGVGPNAGVGLDINSFINMFNFRRNKRMLGFQERLLEEEEQRFIDYRFSRALIIKLTGLKGQELNEFIEHYRPTLDFTQNSTDYEFQDYIKKSFSHFERYKKMMKNFNNNNYPNK